MSWVKDFSNHTGIREPQHLHLMMCAIASGDSGSHLVWRECLMKVQSGWDLYGCSVNRFYMVALCGVDAEIGKV